MYSSLEPLKDGELRPEAQDLQFAFDKQIKLRRVVNRRKSLNAFISANNLSILE